MRTQRPILCIFRLFFILHICMPVLFCIIVIPHLVIHYHSFIYSLIFIQLYFNYTVGDSYIASGAIDGEVKLWTTNGENVGSWSHKSIVSALKVFKDDLGGI